MNCYNVDPITFPHCVERAIPLMTTRPVTSPDNLSQVKLPSTEYAVIEAVEKHSKSDAHDTYGEDAVTNIKVSTWTSTNHDHVPDLSYNPNHIEMDGN